MKTFLKKHFILISILFLILFVLLTWKLPSAAPVIGIAFVGFSLLVTTSSIIMKHRMAYCAGELTRFACARNIFLDIFGILLALVAAVLLSSYMAEFMTKQIDNALLHIIAGVLIGLLVGICVGIFVQQAWGRFVKSVLTS